MHKATLFRLPRRQDAILFGAQVRRHGNMSMLADSLCTRSPCVTSSACKIMYTVFCNCVLRCLQVDVHSKRCQEPGCRKHPSFGYPGGKTQFCAEHKSADMVCYGRPCLLTHFAQAALCDQQCVQGGVHCNSVPRCLQVGVHSKRCQEPGCRKHPSFGFPGGKKQFCSEHKSADMVCYQSTCLLIHFVLAAVCDQQCRVGWCTLQHCSEVPAGQRCGQALPGARVHKASLLRLPRRQEAILCGAQVR